MENLARVASQVRRDIIRMVHAVSSGHPGGSLGCADFFVFMYFHRMEVNPDAVSYTHLTLPTIYSV